MSPATKVRSPMLSVLVATALAAASLPAFASETHRFDVPASTVRSAIRAFASQAQVQILVSGESVTNKSLKAVSGELSTEEALRILLADTGLEPKYVGDRAIALVAAAEPQASSPAQSDPSPNASANAFAIEEVVVSAQKRLERLHDVPAPVSVLNTEALASNNQVLLRDYAASIPGFNVTPNYVGFQNLTIRGITTGSDVPAVSVAIDDVPFGGSYTNGVPDIDPGDLARIEVLRGPQGTLYGASSLGGLVKYVTKEPSTDKYEGRVEAGTSSVRNGSEPGFTVRGSANVPVSDSFAVRVSGFTRQDPGYIDNPRYRIEGVNQATADGARLSGLWRPNDDLRVKVSALYQHSKLDGLHEVVIDPSLHGLQQNYLPGLGGDERSVYAYSVNVDYKLGNVTLTSLTGYNTDRDLNSLDYSFAFGPLVEAAFPGVDGAAFYYHLAHKKFSQELRLAGPLGPKLEWMIGGFYTREHEYRPTETRVDAQDRATLEVLGKYFGFGTQNWFKEYAAFGNLTYHATDRIDIQLGARTNRDELTIGEAIITGPYADAFLGGDPNVAAPISADADAFTYLATVRFKLSPQIMTYARAASGFRPGNANTVIPGIPRQSFPDKTRNFELGLKGDFFGQRVSLDASVFHITWSNIQLQLRDPVNQFPYQGNGSEAKSEGVELSLGLRPSHGLAINAWTSYNNAELTENFPVISDSYGVVGDRLPYSSRWSGQISLQQDFPLWGDAVGFIGGAMTYVGERVGVFQSTALRQIYPSYVKSDLNLGVQSGSWKASVFANNLTDRRGLLSGGIGYFYPAARIYTTPRTIGVNVAKTF